MFPPRAETGFSLMYASGIFSVVLLIGYSICIRVVYIQMVESLELQGFDLSCQLPSPVLSEQSYSLPRLLAKCTYT